MKVQLLIQTIQVLATTASLQTWVTTAFLKAGYSIRSSTAKVMFLVLLSNEVNRRVLIMPSRDMAISLRILPTPRTSSSITLITSAAPLILQMLRPILPSSMPTCHTESCWWMNIHHLRICHISSTARSWMRKQACTIMVQGT